MKLSNFKLLEIIGKSPLDWKARASVVVTTGLFYKKIETVEIYLKFGSMWYFSKTGEFTPGDDVRHLVRMFESKEGKSIWPPQF